MPQSQLLNQSPVVREHPNSKSCGEPWQAMETVLTRLSLVWFTHGVICALASNKSSTGLKLSLVLIAPNVCKGQWRSLNNYNLLRPKTLHEVWPFRSMRKCWAIGFRAIRACAQSIAAWKTTGLRCDVLGQFGYQVSIVHWCPLVYRATMGYCPDVGGSFDWKAWVLGRPSNLWTILHPRNLWRIHMKIHNVYAW